MSFSSRFVDLCADLFAPLVRIEHSIRVSKSAFMHKTTISVLISKRNCKLKTGGLDEVLFMMLGRKPAFEPWRPWSYFNASLLKMSRTYDRAVKPSLSTQQQSIDTIFLQHPQKKTKKKHQRYDEFLQKTIYQTLKGKLKSSEGWCNSLKGLFFMIYRFWFIKMYFP